MVAAPDSRFRDNGFRPMGEGSLPYLETMTPGTNTGRCYFEQIRKAL